MELGVLSTDGVSSVRFWSELGSIHTQNLWIQQADSWEMLTSPSQKQEEQAVVLSPSQCCEDMQS